MGCGHSKINGYFRKSKSQTNKEYSPVNTEKVGVEEKLPDQSTELTENSEDTALTNSTKIKPYGILLPQTEISTSQQDFFKLLDEKIENGPDYDSENETEKAEREARILSLLKNWQSSSLRSLNNTPTRQPKTRNQFQKEESIESSAITSPHIRYSNVYMNSYKKTYIPPTPTAYISDCNQNADLSYQMQYRSIAYPPEVHQTTYPHYRPENYVLDATNYKPNVYQPQYLNRPNRYFQQNVERNVKYNNYYNLPNTNENSKSSGNAGVHESRIEMNPLHRKQYELT